MHVSNQSGGKKKGGVKCAVTYWHTFFQLNAYFRYGPFKTVDIMIITLLGCISTDATIALSYPLHINASSHFKLKSS